MSTAESLLRELVDARERTAKAETAVRVAENFTDSSREVNALAAAFEHESKVEARCKAHLASQPADQWIPASAEFQRCEEDE